MAVGPRKYVTDVVCDEFSARAVNIGSKSIGRIGIVVERAPRGNGAGALYLSR